MEVTRLSSDRPVRDWLVAHKDLPVRAYRGVEGWFTRDRHASYGVAVMRIGSGALLLGWLLVNLPVAARIWGPGSAYQQPFREILGYRWPMTVLQDAGPVEFWLWYAATIALATAFMLGWHARIVTPLLFIFYTALNAQNTMISDGGNYFIRIMLVYLILMDVSRRWSLDERRRLRRAERRRGASRERSQVVTVLHNLGLVLVVAQLCIVYIEAGLYKVQGELWQNGTAIYYPLNSEAYGPFPLLSQALTHFSWPVVLATYFTVIVQIAFVFMLFSRVTRRIALVCILGMHLSIAILMGLPFFSGIMAMGDAVLVSSLTWTRIAAWLALVAGAALARVGVLSRRRGRPRRRRSDGDEPEAETAAPEKELAASGSRPGS